jgi:hypothetical protein
MLVIDRELWWTNQKLLVNQKRTIDENDLGLRDALFAHPASIKDKGCVTKLLVSSLKICLCFFVYSWNLMIQL